MGIKTLLSLSIIPVTVAVSYVLAVEKEHGNDS